MNRSVVGRRGMIGFLVAVSALASSPAGAVTRVTQVIDGLPQVIAPQQIIVSCDPGALPLACTNALNLVGATLVATGQTLFNLVQLPVGVSLQGALDTLRAATGIASAEPNRIFIGSAIYPQTWHFPAAGQPGDSTLLSAGATPPIVAVLDSGVAYEDYLDASGVYARAPVFGGTQFATGWAEYTKWGDSANSFIRFMVAAVRGENLGPTADFHPLQGFVHSDPYPGPCVNGVGAAGFAQPTVAESQRAETYSASNLPGRG